MSNGNLRMFDLKGRTLGLFGNLDRETCLAAGEAILRLGNSPSRHPASLYLGCTGGNPDDVFMLIDCLSVQRGAINTYVMSPIDGMGLLLLLTGRKRFALPHASISTQGLKPSAEPGFSQAKPLSLNPRSGSRIEAHLIERLGTETGTVLLGLPEIDLKMAIAIGLIHRIITAPKPSRLTPGPKFDRQP